MPKVTKQTQTSSPDIGGVLSRIRPVQVREGGVKLNVYGRGKSGKTRLACTFPKPLLIIGTEDGTKSVSTVKGVDFVRMAHTDELAELCEAAPARYKTVVLDTAGGMQDLVLKEVLGLDEVPMGRNWGMTDQQTWGIVTQQTNERMRQVLDLADKHDTNVVVIAHERSFNDGGESDVIQPTVGSALTPKCCAWLNAAVDYICQCFIREQEIKKEVTKDNGKKGTIKVKTGKMEYCLRVGPHVTYITGFRLPPGGPELPDCIVNPDYGKILSLIQGKEPR
jgi:hypothetical protein